MSTCSEGVSGTDLNFSPIEYDNLSNLTVKSQSHVMMYEKWCNFGIENRVLFAKRGTILEHFVSTLTHCIFPVY